MYRGRLKTSKYKYMKEIKIKIYKFEELSDEAKEKAMNWWRETDDLPMLKEDLTEEAQNLLDNITKNDNIPLGAFEVKKVYFCLGFVQADYVTVEYSGEVTDNDNVISTFEVEGYELKHQFNPDISIYGDFEEEEEKYKLEQIIKNQHEQMCKKLMKWEHDYVLEQDSDEVVSKNIIANEYDFREDGTRWVK